MKNKPSSKKLIIAIVKLSRKVMSKILSKKWNDEKLNVFFKWSLAFCDSCRRKREISALKKLPEVIKTLANEW